ncbi:hypothetical protein BCF33_1703 [Hasllibacter halocynthiae]|uniref:Uncharacterized protein n=1 Tax=Hasllibacter halocynthiae TaxID=595589 RepID=A0A2T0X1M6_9RHOB|nr:hypothetical protein [Hasllibacter halocynthiae]PRY92841.1 hypothetical protein BCF33_1703 [Hasllibacter halocynthiae]
MTVASADPIRPARAAALAALLALAGCAGAGGDGGGDMPRIDMSGRTAVDVALPRSGRDLVLACRPGPGGGEAAARAAAAARDLDAGFAAMGADITGRFLAALGSGGEPDAARIARIARRTEADLTRRIEREHGCAPARPRRPAPRGS